MSTGQRLNTTPERSALMRRVRQAGTGAELIVRRVLTSLGHRYRINAKGLPGRPDVVNRRRRKAIFVHGCFWHGHEDCRRARLPKSNRPFWAAKIAANVARDESKRAALVQRGFAVLIVWECELRDERELRRRLDEFWSRD